MDSEMESIRTKDDIITLRTGRSLASFDSLVESGVERILVTIDRALHVHKSDERKTTAELC